MILFFNFRWILGSMEKKPSGVYIPKNSLMITCQNTIWLVVEPTPLKNMLVKLEIISPDKGWNFQKCLTNHHLEYLYIIYITIY